MLSRNIFKGVKPFAQASQRGFWGSSSSAEEGISDEPAKRVAVTGAAGNISYAILYRLASGEFLGKR